MEEMLQTVAQMSKVESEVQMLRKNKVLETHKWYGQAI